MSYVLGIDIDDGRATAAVSRRHGDGGWDGPEVLRFADRDGAGCDVMARVGDSVPLVLDGRAVPADRLAAELTRRAVDRVEADEGEPAAHVAVVHPVGWGAYRCGLLRDALERVGLADTTLLPAPLAAAEGYLATAAGRDHTLGVSLWGEARCSSSVVATGAAGTPEILGWRADAQPLGGADLDEAVLDHVRTRLGRTLEVLDPADPHARRAMLGLGQQCRRARQALASATRTEVVVALPDTDVRVPISRAEVEELIRPALRLTVDALARTVASCGLRPAQLDRVLMVGPAARGPLLAELVAATVTAPLVTSADPVTAVVSGAAVAARRAVPARRVTVPARGVARPPTRDDPELDAGTGPAGSTDPTEASGDGSPPRPPVTVTPLVLPSRRRPRMARRGDPPAYWLIQVVVILLVLGALLAFGPRWLGLPDTLHLPGLS